MLLEAGPTASNVLRDPWPAAIDTAAWVVVVAWLAVIPAVVMLGPPSDSFTVFVSAFWSINVCALAVVGLWVLRTWPPDRPAQIGARGAVLAAGLNLLAVATGWTGVGAYVIGVSTAVAGVGGLLVAAVGREMFPRRRLRWTGYVVGVGLVVVGIGVFTGGVALFGVGLLCLFLMPFWMRKVARQINLAARNKGV